MAHGCDGCKYSFLGVCAKEREIFSPLRNSYINIEINETKKCCGYMPESVVVSDEQPRCNYFENK